jgi:hypothetical protein
MQKIYADQSEQSIAESETAIRTQIRLEAATRASQSWGHAIVELFNRRNIVRTAVAIMVLQVGSLSGTLVIQQYQSILYASLGFTGQKSLLITGCYGFMGFAVRFGFDPFPPVCHLQTLIHGKGANCEYFVRI